MFLVIPHQPILHKLEKEGLVSASNQEVSGRIRKVYTITEKGNKALAKEKQEWSEFSMAVNQVLTFGVV